MIRKQCLGSTKILYPHFLKNQLMYLIGSILFHDHHLSGPHCLGKARRGAPGLAWKRKAGAGTREARAPNFQAAFLYCPSQWEGNGSLLSSDALLLPASWQAAYSSGSASHNCPSLSFTS